MANPLKSFFTGIVDFIVLVINLCLLLMWMALFAAWWTLTFLVTCLKWVLVKMAPLKLDTHKTINK